MIAFRDALWDAQLLRALAASSSDGADIGACLAAAASIRPGDRESWYGAWMKLAERTRTAAAASLHAGDRPSARHGFLSAATYYRTAAIFHLERPVSGAVVTAYRLHREAFRAAAALTAPSIEPLSIPFQGTALPAYFCRAHEVSGAPGTRRPVVISVGGYDSTAEESYFFNGAAATARGYHCLLFDGPGQGQVLIEQGLPFRPDWETVISAVIDVVAGRPDVDPSRIVLVGESLGGYLAARGAARDARVAACALNPAQVGLFSAALQRLPVPSRLTADLPHGPRWLVALLRRLLDRVARKPGTAGWALRRGMLTHGKDSAWDYFVDTARYEQAALIPTIRCPVLVCDAADDLISRQAKDFYDRLTCDKTYRRFTADEGAGDHCVMGNRALYHQELFSWLATCLAKDSDSVERERRDPVVVGGAAL